MNAPENFSYVIYGLRLVSDRPIPGLVPIESKQAAPPDLSVRFDSDKADAAQERSAEEALWYTTDILDAQGNPALKIWKGKNGGEYSIRYSHGLTFLVNAGLTAVTIRHDEPMPAEDVAAFFLGPVLGIILRLRGVTCLHASAVTVGGKAVAFVGTAGAGKSTTAALFAQRGHAVLSDDIVTLLEREDSFYVSPAYPFLNLWPDSLAMLSVSPSALLPEYSNEEKRRLALEAGHSKFQREALPLAAIYLLGDRSADSGAPFVAGLAPQDCLIGLVANTYGNRLLDSAMRAEEFSVLGRLAKMLPVRRIVAHEDATQLLRLYEVISEDVARILASSRS